MHIKPPLAIVGNINLDLKTSPIAPDPGLFKDGETSLAHLHESIGGGGANTAMAAARMGGNVTFVGAIGNDALGERLRAVLVREGIHPRLAIKSAPTGRSLALNWQGHQRHFLSHLPSSLLLESADVHVSELAAAGCRHLYRADVWFAPQMLAEGNLKLFQAAKEQGLETSLDINWDPHWRAAGDEKLISERIESVARTLAHVSYVHGNERELCFFAGVSKLEDAARWLFARGACTLIIHRGAQGSAAWTVTGERVECPALAVDRVVSETGTGDIFTAAFLLRDSLPLDRRLAECNSIAAQHLSGAATFLPELDG